MQSETCCLSGPPPIHFIEIAKGDKAMKKLSKNQILEFLQKFDIVRPGCYSVSDDVLEACLEEYIKHKTDNILPYYEVLLHFLWTVNNYNSDMELYNSYLQPEASISLEREFIHNNPHNILRFFDQEEIQDMKDYLEARS